MISCRRWILAWLGIVLAIPATPTSAEFFPDAHELFKPLKADPRELQYFLKWAVPVSNHSVGEVALGDMLGLYRGSFAGGEFQLSGGGGIFARFNVSSESNDTQVIDFYGNMPLDYRRGDWATRILAYHTSSHLGDDYVKEKNIQTEKHTFDNLKFLLAYNGWKAVRIYGGYNYLVRTIPGDDRNAFQGGLEWSRLVRSHSEVYWATDFQSWERTGWNGQLHTQIGWRVFKRPEQKRSITLFGEFGAGGMPYGQFYRENETYWGMGLKFQLT
jgi:hypothetical protein